MIRTTSTHALHHPLTLHPPAVAACCAGGAPEHIEGVADERHRAHHSPSSATLAIMRISRWLGATEPMVA